MRDTYEDDFLTDEPSLRRRSFAPLLLAGLAGGLVACLLLIWLLRWPPTGSVLRPILIGGTEGALLMPVRTSVPAAQQESSTSLTRSSSLSPTATPSPEMTSHSQFPSPTVAAAPKIAGPSSGLDSGLVEELRGVMLDAINTDRKAEGLSEVAWDDTATSAGQAHAEDMLTNDYFSHWNMAGYGPEHRYALAGGLDAVAENIYEYWYRYDDGRPAPITDWDALIRQAEADLMNSPGHRRTILDPFNTHVGVGIAYDAQKGELRLAQEFVRRWVRMEPLPQHLAVGTTVIVTAQLLPRATEPLINLAFQPQPTPVSVEDVPSGTYSSPAELYQALKPDVTDGRFMSQIRLSKEGQGGLYSIRVWVMIAGQQVLAVERILWLEEVRK